jgi:hypothetical protein
MAALLVLADIRFAGSPPHPSEVAFQLMTVAVVIDVSGRFGRRL